MTKEEMLKRIQELENELEKTKVELYETNKKLNEALVKIANYQEKYDIERTRRFIPKGEKLNSIIINETEEIIKEEKKERKTNKGKKYNKKKFDYEKYVVETRVINPEEKNCDVCGSTLVDVSEKVRYAVEVIPSQIKVIKLIKKTKKCPNCNKENKKLYYPLSDALGGSILTPSLASFIAYHKYELGIPFEHLASHITNSIGFEINKQNLANYMSKIALLLEPIFHKMKEDLLNNESKVIHSDETTLVISKPENETNRKKSYVYVYTSSFYDSKQIRIYEFHESRSIDITKDWLVNFKGVIVCDDFEGYNKLAKENTNIKLQKCWAHVRRRFVDILKNLNEKEKRNSLSFKILNEIEKLFNLEKGYKKNKFVPSQIVEKRNKDFIEIKEELYDLVFNCNPIPNSSFEKAINYTKDCWNDLFTLLNNGYVELSNNTAERAVKPFVIQRKVFQTSGSYAGARYTTILFSIIQTCKINNINVEKYLEYVLSNIDNESIDKLLPYSNYMNKFTNKI